MVPKRALIYAAIGLLTLIAIVISVPFRLSVPSFRRNEQKEVPQLTSNEATAPTASKSPVTPPRVACLVLTWPQRIDHEQLFIRETWGPQCDGTYFYVEGGEKVTKNSVPIEDRKGNRWLAYRDMLAHAGRELAHNYDWFMVVEDTAYIVVGNLRYILTGLDAKKPMQIGTVERTGSVSTVSRKSGYVLSQSAVSRLVGKRGAHKCVEKGDADDIAGSCDIADMVHVNAVDGEGYPLFYDKKPYDIVTPESPNASKMPVAFNGCDKECMYTLHFFLNEFQLKGVTTVFKGSLSTPATPTKKTL